MLRITSARKNFINYAPRLCYVLGPGQYRNAVVSGRRLPEPDPPLPRYCTDPAQVRSEKAISLIWIGQHAAFVFTKDLIPVACNETVNQITKRTWDELPYCRQRLPEPSQFPPGPEHCIS